jgi:hypothetical protein
MTAHPAAKRREFLERRCKQLADQIADDQELLGDYERKLGTADDPKEKKRCREEIARLKGQIQEAEFEYDQLCTGAGAVEPARAAGDLFATELISALPFPLAAPCLAYNASDDDKERFELLDLLLRNSVKYLAAVALAQYRRDYPKSPHLKAWVLQLSQRYLRNWLEMLNDISRHYGDMAERPPLAVAVVDGLARVIPGASAMSAAFLDVGKRMEMDDDGGMPVTVEQFIRRLAAYREMMWEVGTAQLPSAFFHALIPVVQPALIEWIEAVPLLTHYRLRYAERAFATPQGWTYDMASWQGPNLQPKRSHSLILPKTGAEPPHKSYRLYLCTASGEPLVNLHPLVVHLQDQLYFWESADAQGEMILSMCYGGGILHPMPHVQKSLNSIFEATDDGVDEIADVLENIESEIEIQETGVPPSLAQLCQRMDADAIVALQIALGEAWRIGHFWLGLEFLLMGLSKQERCLLPGRLHELGIEPGEWRASLRGLVRVQPEKKETWRTEDVRTLGATAWDALHAIDPRALAAEYTAGNAPKAGVTPRMMAVLREAARLAGAGKAGPDHLLVAALQHPHNLAVNRLLGQVTQAGQDPRQWLAEVQRRAGGLEPEGKRGALGGPQDVGALFAPPLPPSPLQQPPRGAGLLGRLGRDLTALAKADQIRPAIGGAARKAMGQMGEILLQAQGNNPILLGDPGVGKTAIVEGFAWRLANDPKVKSQLADKRVVDLPPTALLAGAKYRGDLEQRLQQVVAEVQAAQGQTIVFIDEIHAILGGKAEGGLGAIADALKPALARGEFPCIGATTVAEYRRHIESDPALARRFTPVWIDEPSPEDAFEIAKTVAQAHLAARHGVAYPDEVVQEAVRLAVRYLHDEFLPGKAIKLLDQAGPRVILAVR